MALSWCLLLQPPYLVPLILTAATEGSSSALPGPQSEGQCRFFSLTFARCSQRRRGSVSHRLSSDYLGKIAHVTCTHKRADISSEHNIIDTEFIFLWPHRLLSCVTEVFAMSFFPLLFCLSCSLLGLCLDKVLAPEGTHTATSVCPLLHSKLQPYCQTELIIGAKSQHQSVHRNSMSLWLSAIHKATIICIFLFYLAVYSRLAAGKLTQTQLNWVILNLCLFKFFFCLLICKSVHSAFVYFNSSNKCWRNSLMKCKFLICLSW